MADIVPDSFSHLIPLFDAVPDGSNFTELKSLSTHKRYSLVTEFHRAYVNSASLWPVTSENPLVRGMAKTAAAAARSFRPAERESDWEAWMRQTREYEHFYKEELRRKKPGEHEEATKEHIRRKGIDENPDYDTEENASEGVEEGSPVVKRRRINRRTISRHQEKSDSSESEHEPLGKHHTSQSPKVTKPRRKKYKPKNVVKVDGGQVVINPRPMSPEFQGKDPIKDDQMNILYLRSLLSTERAPGTTDAAVAVINPDKYLGWCAGCVDSTRDECGFVKWGQRCEGCARMNKTGCIYSLPSRERAFRRDTMNILGSTGPMNIKRIVEDIRELQLQAHTTMALFKHSHTLIVNKQRELACLAREIYKEGPETVKEALGDVDVQNFYLALKESVQASKVDLKQNELEDMRKLLEAVVGTLEIKREEEVKTEAH
ncbi:hypothetical protein BDN72DRAFT_865710 [Pluteus cervinus]|uniref:Uncharacterized protein n=1 Tax=Pluteus cervinus TaxID=181527 RepID=A0ACD2ZZ97_9AGAR|nr:hypothetical protein BDN72DRAFT_865710 [Pluteus cervinus]